MLSVGMIYALLFYAATAMLVVGLAMRIRKYAKTPNPLKIPLTPAPTTKAGVVVRITKEVIFFKSLFRANKWIWAFGYIFHFTMLLVVLRHFRYFTDPVWFWVDLIQPFGKYAAFGMLLGLGGLLIRRIFVERIRYISSPSDYLMLLLFIAIAGSGMFMKFVSHVDIIAVKAYFLGLMTFSIQPLPTDLFLLVHLGLVVTLMIIFPISKLLHAPGLFFSPTLNQVDNPREQRHLAAWAAELDNKR